MRRHAQRNLLVVLSLSAACAGPRVPSEAAANAAAARVSAEADKGQEGKPAIAEAMGELRPESVTAARLQKWAPETVEAVRDAASTAAFYFPEVARYAELQERAFDEKARRGTPGPHDLREMFRTFMASRRFDKAKALREHYPGTKFPSMPETFAVDPAPPEGPQAYSIGRDWKTATLTAAPLGRFAVVMATFPGCPASEQALKDLAADPATARVLRGKTLLLTDRFDAEGVAEIKKIFGLRDFLIARTRSDFPGLAFNASPRFYFLKDGKPVADMIGWGGEGGAKANRAEFLAGLAEAAR